MYLLFVKRVIDFFVGIILLLFLLPLFLAIGFFVKITSKGPVFFVQKRAGKDGIYFSMLKFRTMVADSTAEKKEFEPGEKKRITSFGRFLRKSKMDELPQIINVIKGDMSLVGPRPEVKKYIEICPEKWKKILQIRPGITDPASLKFRNEEEILAASLDPQREYMEKIMPQKLALYEEYVSNISFRRDVKIIFATIFNILFR
jgi:lipopolysaccharide/colanic/teichoic acid biosynthesis glycosyltransferase